MDSSQLANLSDFDLLARVDGHCDRLCPSQTINKIAARMLIAELETRASDTRTQRGEASDERDTRVALSASAIGKIARWAMS